jgi:hypothetical protein
MQANVDVYSLFILDHLTILALFLLRKEIILQTQIYQNFQFYSNSRVESSCSVRKLFYKPNLPKKFNSELEGDWSVGPTKAAGRTVWPFYRTTTRSKPITPPQETGLTG